MLTDAFNHFWNRSGHFWFLKLLEHLNNSQELCLFIIYFSCFIIAIIIRRSDQGQNTLVLKYYFRNLSENENFVFIIYQKLSKTNLIRL